MLEELKNIKSGKENLREFGLTIGAILLILGGVSLWRGKHIYPYLFSAGAVFIGLGLILPGILKLPQKIWIGFSIVIGFFMSRLILAILFYAVITPTGLFLRFFGKDVLDQRIEKSKVSYWVKRPKEIRSKKSYENQY